MSKRRNTYLRDINGAELREGDRILYEVERLSSSQSTWGQRTNKYHGRYRVHGTIEFKDGRFMIIGNENEIKELKDPKGKEQFKQNVWFERRELAGAKVEKIQKSKGGRSRRLNRYEILTKEITGV